MAFWGIFELKISKIFVIFGNSTLKFIEMSNIKQKKKKSNLGPKMPSLGILCLNLTKYHHIWNQYPRIY